MNKYEKKELFHKGTAPFVMNLFVFFLVFRIVRISGNEDFVDAEIIHIDDFKGKVLPYVGIRFPWNAADAISNQAGQRFIQVFLFIRQFIFDAEEIFKFFNRKQSFDQPVVRSSLDDAVASSFFSSSPAA